MRARQQNALGGVPLIDLQMNGAASVITKADIVTVTTVNTGALTTIELWGRITNTFEAWNFAPGINYGNKWTWFSTNGFSAALPAGTQTATVYGDTFVDALTATGGVQFLNGAGATVFKSDSVNEIVTFGSAVTTGKHAAIDYSGNNAVLSIGSADGNAIYLGQYNAGVSELSHDADLHIIRATNSVNAFQLLDSSANALFTMDTTNKRFRIQGTGTNGGGGRLHFGDYDNVYIGETGTSDTDALTIHSEQGITFQNSGGTMATLSATGAATFGNNVNSATAFAVLNAAGTSMFNINTTAGNITIRASATTYTQRLCHNQANAATTNMVLGDCQATGQADLAEYYDTDGTPEPGDIVIPKPGLTYGITRSHQSGQPNAIGIVSTNPMADGILGHNVTSGNRQPVALAGRVPLKVSLENGPIEAGDLLMVGSHPGTAAKATGGAPTVGVALESYTSESPRVSSLVRAEEADRATAHAGELAPYSSQPSQWPADTGKIMAMLKMTGGSPLSNTDINNAVFNGGVVARDTTFNGIVAFNQGVTFADNATFNGTIAVNKDTAGIAKVLRGQQKVTITFEKPHPTIPIVTVSPKQFTAGSFRVTDVTTDEFTIELSTVQQQDIEFNWTAFDTTTTNY